MDVTTNLKYKVKTQQDGEVLLYFPRDIEIIEETLMKTLSQFGK